MRHQWLGEEPNQNCVCGAKRQKITRMAKPGAKRSHGKEIESYVFMPIGGAEWIEKTPECTRTDEKPTKTPATDVPADKPAKAPKAVVKHVASSPNAVAIDVHLMGEINADDASIAVLKQLADKATDLDQPSVWRAFFTALPSLMVVGKVDIGGNVFDVSVPAHQTSDDTSVGIVGTVAPAEPLEPRPPGWDHLRWQPLALATPGAECLARAAELRSGALAEPCAPPVEAPDENTVALKELTDGYTCIWVTAGAHENDSIEAAFTRIFQNEIADYSVEREVKFTDTIKYLSHGIAIVCSGSEKAIWLDKDAACPPGMCELHRIAFDYDDACWRCAKEPKPVETVVAISDVKCPQCAAMLPSLDGKSPRPESLSVHNEMMHPPADVSDDLPPLDL